MGRVPSALGSDTGAPCKISGNVIRLGWEQRFEGSRAWAVVPTTAVDHAADVSCDPGEPSGYSDALASIIAAEMTGRVAHAIEIASDRPPITPLCYPESTAFAGRAKGSVTHQEN